MYLMTTNIGWYPGSYEMYGSPGIICGKSIGYSKRYIARYPI